MKMSKQEVKMFVGLMASGTLLMYSGVLAKWVGSIIEVFV